MLAIEPMMSQYQSKIPNGLFLNATSVFIISYLTALNWYTQRTTQLYRRWNSIYIYVYMCVYIIISICIYTSFIETMTAEKLISTYVYFNVETSVANQFTKLVIHQHISCLWDRKILIENIFCIYFVKIIVFEITKWHLIETPRWCFSQMRTSYLWDFWSTGLKMTC